MANHPNRGPRKRRQTKLVIKDRAAAEAMLYKKPTAAEAEALLDWCLDNEDQGGREIMEQVVGSERNPCVAGDDRYWSPESSPAAAMALTILANVTKHHPEAKNLESADVAHALVHTLSRMLVNLYGCTPDEVAAFVRKAAQGEADAMARSAEAEKRKLTTAWHGKHNKRVH